MGKLLFRLSGTLLLVGLIVNEVSAQETCVSNTGSNTTIIIPPSTSITGGGQPLTDVTITAYTGNGICVGSKTWKSGSASSLTVWGDNAMTPDEIDGMANGETIQYAITDNATGTRYPDVSVSYSQGSGKYVPDAFMYLSSMTGTGAPLKAYFALSSSSADLGSVAVGQSRTAQVTVSNPGGARTLNITGVGSSHNAFTVSPTSAVIAPGVSRTFTITFTPQTASSASGTISFTHDGEATAGSSVSVNGTGVAAAAGSVVVNPTSHAFGTVVAGDTRTVQVTVQHQGGTKNLTISGVTSTNAVFSVSPTTASVAPGASASFTVTFAPTAGTGGAQVGTITFAHDAGGTQSTSTVALTGTGYLTGHFAVSPGSVSLGNVDMGKSTTAQVTVTNQNGSRNLSVSGVSSSNAAFTVSPSTATVTPNGSKTFTITFTPQAVGSANGTINFTHDGTSTSNVVSVSGVGVSVPVPGAVTASPATLSFGTVTNGTTSTAQVTLRHDGGTKNLTVSGVTSSNPVFSVSPTTASIAPGATASFTITFAPGTNGAQAGTLTFAHDAGGVPNTSSVAVSGAGAAPVAYFALSSSSADLGSVAVGQSRTAQVTVSNPGGARTLNITGVGSSHNAFTVSPTSAVIAPGVSRTFTITFTPQTASSASGTISFTHDGEATAGSSVSVNGTGVAAAAGSVVVNPTSHAFGTVVAGDTRTVQVTVQHQGGTKNLTISGVTSTNAVFSVSPTTASVAPGASASFTITFAPNRVEAFTGRIVFAHDGMGPAAEVSVSGSGTAQAPAAVSVTPSFIEYGNVVKGSATSRSITVRNESETLNLVISGASSTNPDFTVSPSAATLAPKGSGTFVITFTPGQTGGREGVIRLTHNGQDGTSTVAVNGTGILPQPGDLTVYPSVQSFGTVAVGSTGVREIILRHEGGMADLNISAIRSSNASFKVRPASVMLAPNTSVTVAIEFSPQSAAEHQGTITFEHNGQSAGSVQVDGRGSRIGRLVVDTGVFDLGTARNGETRTREIAVRNDGGTEPIQIASVTSSNPLYSVSPGKATIAPNGSAVFVVTFAPLSAAPGNQRTVITFQHDGQNSPTTVEAVASVAAEEGDGNGDGRVDVVDLVQLNRFVKGKKTPTGDEMAALDMAPFPGGDGKLDQNDVSVLSQAIVLGVWPNGAPVAQKPPKAASQIGQGEVNSDPSVAQGEVLIELSEGQAAVSLTAHSTQFGLQAELTLEGLRDLSQVVRDPSLPAHVRLVMAVHRETQQLRFLAYHADGQALPGEEMKMLHLGIGSLRPEQVQVHRLSGVSADDNRSNLTSTVRMKSSTAAPGEDLPVEYALSAAYPNPFNPQTNFTLRLVETQEVTVEVYDMRGSRVTVLHRGMLSGGEEHPFTFEALSLSSGQYFIVAKGPHFQQVRPVTLLK